MLEKMASEGRIQNLLGYNEPDLAGQGNMNVSEALRLWPKYEELKRISEAAGQPLSLGGPVVAVSALCGTSCKGAPTAPCKHGNWQKDFMDGVSQRQLEVDFMPLHIYDIPDPEKFLTFVDDVHNCYGLPIWITEFAKRDWSANATKPNKYSVEEVNSFMEVVIPGLEEREFVQKYSWFDTHTNNHNYEKLRTSELIFDANESVAVPVGETYARL